jgi:hypothetical protein
MTHTPASFSLVSAPLLHCASLLVPHNRRATWLQEWSSELWYVVREARSEQSSFVARERFAATFCVGAFQDAMYLRREQRALITRAIRPSRSSLRTTAALFAIAIVSFFAALLLPNVRSAVRPSPYRDPVNLVLIDQPGNFTYEFAHVRMRNYRLWRERTHRIFSEFAYYSPTIKQVRVGERHTAEFRVARVSANLFPMLGVQIPSIAHVSELPVLLVSPAVAQQLGDQAPGSEVKLGIRRAVFGGVLPVDQWRLPGSFDAWLIEPGANSPAIADTARGYVLARRIPSAENVSLGDRWGMPAPESLGGYGSYEFATLSSIDRIPSTFYLFAVILALLSLPATTSLPLGEYPAGSEPISWPLRFRRWLFLAIKFSLLLPTIYFAPLDLAYALPVAPVTSQYIQICASFVIALFSFRWVLKDQRHRCPVCLSTLTHPARVGEPSRNFLGWNGTELICTGGHGLLHVPELPTSWFATQRWLYLDSSWSRIFLGSA